MRVRKLARELERSPDDLLRVLAEIGHERFRSEDDMLSDAVVEQVRRAARTIPPRATIRPERVRRELDVVSEPAGDLMATLVPGVVRVGARASVKATVPPPETRRRPTPTHPAPSTPRPAAPEPQDGLGAEGGAAPLGIPRHGQAPGPAGPGNVRSDSGFRGQPGAEAEVARLRVELAEAREREAAARASLEALRLDAEREQEALRAQLEVTRAELLSRPVPEPDQTLLTLFEERGLRGVDEAERAVASLAALRLFGRTLDQLVPVDAAAIRRLLADRLVLLGGPPPDGLALASVTVSPERAEVPGADRISRTAGRIGEQLLLNGYRRVLVVGVAPRWQGLIREHVDRRVELVFRATLDKARPPEGDVRIDLVVTWNGSDEPDGKPPPRITVRASTIGEFLERWSSSLV